MTSLIPDSNRISRNVAANTEYRIQNTVGVDEIIIEDETDDRSSGAPFMDILIKILIDTVSHQELILTVTVHY